MPRRSPYTKVEKVGQQRPSHVRGMGDVVFRGFQCLSSECTSFITIREDQMDADFAIECPTCDFVHRAGCEAKFFDYRLLGRPESEDYELIEDGEFLVLHDDYVEESQRLKYCLLCYTLKPLTSFGIHRSRDSGRQGECRSCKNTYNGIKNQTRITDQHREAAQRRRLYRTVAQDVGRLNSRIIYDKFQGKCFKCRNNLTYATRSSEYHLDHTLPVRLLWPYTTQNATLLCRDCNSEKTGKWPSEVYSDTQLRRLARLTGFPYALLSGAEVVNQQAIEHILADPDAFIEEWIHEPDSIEAIRKLILDHEDIDIFDGALYVADNLLEAEEQQE